MHLKVSERRKEVAFLTLEGRCLGQEATICSVPHSAESLLWRFREKGTTID